MNSRSRRYTIGHHGSAWTPDRAREETKDILRAMSKSLDPTEEKRKARNGLSVTEFAALYFDEGCHTKKATTIAFEKGVVERHVKPLVGKRMVKSLSRPDLERLQSDIASGKTEADIKTKTRGRAIVKGGRHVANRTLDLMSTILNFARDRSLITEKPAHGVRKFKLKPRER